MRRLSKLAETQIGSIIRQAGGDHADAWEQFIGKLELADAERSGDIAAEIAEAITDAMDATDTAIFSAGGDEPTDYLAREIIREFEACAKRLRYWIGAESGEI